MDTQKGQKGPKPAGKTAYIILHNVRSVYNVGSAFRTADALGIDTIFLTGYTPTPLDRFNQPRKDLAKVALGAEKTLAWEYVKNPVTLIERLKREGVQCIAVEQSESSVDYKNIKVQYPVAFLFGNEVSGVSKSLLSKMDVIAEIPMSGKKESLNVSVSLGVALFRMLGR